MPTPIFVFGMHRSGTTWLANQISEHSNIVAIKHPDHFGIKESGFYELWYNRFGDLSNKTSYVEFVEVISASDYFVLSGIDKEFLYSLWPVTYDEFFRKVMDEYARRNSVDYWLEKSPKHTLAIDHIAEYYQDGVFVAVRRSLLGFLSSIILRQSEGDRGKFARFPFIFRTVIRWIYYNKLITNYEKKNPGRIFVITYEETINNLEKTMQQICNHIGIPFEHVMTYESYKPNTSHKNFELKKEVMTDLEKQFATFTHSIMQLIPLSVLRFFGKRVIQRNARKPLPDYSFQITHGTNQPGGFSQKIT